MTEEWTMKDSVCWALHEMGAYREADHETWPTIPEITAAVSPTGNSAYLRDAITKAVEAMVAEGDLIWVIFAGRYALSSELTPSFKRKAAAALAD